MSRRTVRIGLNLLSIAIVLVILATFFHEAIARLLALSPGTEIRFVYLGLAAGGAAGCSGVLIAAIGFLRVERSCSRPVPLLRSILFLTAAILLFFVLLVSSFRPSMEPHIRPGETVII